MAEKGPLDMLADLRARAAKVKADIAAGKSGDGKTTQDLKPVLQDLLGQIRNIEKANPGSSMYPSMRK